MGSLLEFLDVDPLDAAVGAKPKRWREQRGMSVDDLACLMDMSPGEERRAEAGRAHLGSLRIGAATTALRLPLWARVAHSRAC